MAETKELYEFEALYTQDWSHEDEEKESIERGKKKTFHSVRHKQGKEAWGLKEAMDKIASKKETCHYSYDTLSGIRNFYLIDETNAMLKIEESRKNCGLYIYFKEAQGGIMEMMSDLTEDATGSFERGLERIDAEVRKAISTSLEKLIEDFNLKFLGFGTATILQLEGRSPEWFSRS